MAQSAQDRRQELYERYQQVPQHLVAEIVRGTLYVMPRPAPRHANASSVLGGELNGAFQRGRGGPGGWWILDEPELHLVELEPMIPDRAGWRVERMPELPETARDEPSGEEPGAGFTVVPDWVCEVVSKSTEALNREQKLPLYAEQGVRHAWLVDPIAKTLEVRILGDDGRWREVRMYQGDAKVRAAPFEAVEIELGALWGGPVGTKAVAATTAGTSREPFQLGGSTSQRRARTPFS